MILPVFLSCCLTLAVAQIIHSGQPASEPVCQGSLVLTAADESRETIRFGYVKPSRTCPSENLRLKLKVSRAVVEGCGTFILYTRKNGMGASQEINESSGELTASDIGFSTVKSIEGTGCVGHKHNIPVKGIKKPIEEVIKEVLDDMEEIEEKSVTTKRSVPAVKRTDEPGERDGVHFTIGEAQDQFQNEVTPTEGSDTECEDCGEKTTVVVTVLVALIVFAILAIVILVYSKHRSTSRYSQPGGNS